MTEASADRWAIALNYLTPEDRQAVATDGQDKLEVLNRLQDETNKAKEASMEKRWRYRRPGHEGETVILRDLFGKIATWLNRFREIGDIVVQNDPYHAALPWAGVRFLIQVAIGDINKYGFAIEAAESIARVISRFAIFESIYLHRRVTATNTMKALESAVVRMYTSTLIYLARTKRYFDQNTARRILQSIIRPQEEFETLLHSIAAEQETVYHCAHGVDAERTIDLGDRVEALSIDEKTNNVALRRLLATIDGPIDRMVRQLAGFEDRLIGLRKVRKGHHQRILRQAMTGSGEWLLQDQMYKYWRDTSASSLLWIHGLPGSGKSTLLSIIIEAILADTEAGRVPAPAYFYCSRSTAEAERQNPDAVLASILRQLSEVQRGKALLPPVVELYNTQGKGFTSKGPDIIQCQKLIVNLIELHGSATIIIDALDECDPDKRQDLLEAFEYILKESAGLVKIFVSSREDQEIECTLRSYRSLRIASDRNSHDIEAYVRQKTESLVRKGRLLRNSQARENVKRQIICHVCHVADGMFRWASLQLELLCQQKLDRDVISMLGRLPPKLEQLYHEIYTQLALCTGEGGRLLFENTLKWLLCAQTTLSASTFLHAISITSGQGYSNTTKEHVLDLCRNLVVYDEDLDIFRFAHLSVREFLEIRVDYSKVSCNILAAESCLLYMFARPEYKQLVALASGAIANPYERLALPDNETLDSFGIYALNQWMVHCERASQDARSADTSFGRNFRGFISIETENHTAFHAWVQWYLKSWQTRESSLQLQELLVRHSVCSKASFYVAVAYGFTEIVNASLRKSQGELEERRSAFILASVCGQNDVLDILMISRDMELTPMELRYVARYLDAARLSRLLGAPVDGSLDGLVLRAGLDGDHDGRIGLLLQKDPELMVDEGTLNYAIDKVSSNDFRLLLDRTSAICTSVQTACEKKEKVAPDKIALLLDKVEWFPVNAVLLALLRNPGRDDSTKIEIVRLLLSKDRTAAISKEVFQEAANNTSEILDLLLNYCGKITQRMLDNVAGFISPEGLIWCLEKGSEITGRTLRKCAKWHGRKPDSHPNLYLLLDRADEILIAQEMSSLLRGCARRGDRAIEAIRWLFDRAGEDIINEEMNNMLRCATDVFRLQHNISECRLPRTRMVKLLLDRAQDSAITEGVLIGAATYPFMYGSTDRDVTLDPESHVMPFFVERAQDSQITEGLMMAVAHNGWNKIMQILLPRVDTINITEDVVVEAVGKLELNVVLQMLALVEEIHVTDDLLEAAAANWESGCQLVGILLTESSTITLPQDALLAATRFGPRQAISAWEESLGPTVMTEAKLCALVRERPYPEDLLCWLKPQYLTEKVLLTALCHNTDPNVSHAVIERSDHLPITLRILEAVARQGSLPQFRYFWARGRIVPIPQSLLEAAVCTCMDNPEIFNYLLDDTTDINAGERFCIAILNRHPEPIETFDLMKKRGVPVTITQRVLGDGGPDLWDIDEIRWILSHNPDLEITDDLFRVLASNGQNYTIEELSEDRGLEQPPTRWINIAEFYNAAKDGDVDALRELVEQGVEPDTSNPAGRTPLCAAVRNRHNAATELLLAHGAQIDQLWMDFTPLTYCAGYLPHGRYDSMIRLLIEAGASLGFKDRRGKTPEEAAKKKENINLFMYLKKCRKLQESAGKNHDIDYQNQLAALAKTYLSITEADESDSEAGDYVSEDDESDFEADNDSTDADDDVSKADESDHEEER